MDFSTRIFFTRILVVIGWLINMAARNSVRKRALEVPTRPVSEREQKYLNNHIEHAIKALGHRDKTYVISKETEDCLRNNLFDKAGIRRLVFEIMRYLNSPSLTVEVELHIGNESKFSSNGKTGQYQVSGLDKKITLYLKSDYTYFELIAIICHECTHDYLLANGIKIEPEKENEIFTDIAALYLGFDTYIQAGYKETRRIGTEHYNGETYSFQTERVKIGYIDSTQIKYIINKLAEYREAEFQIQNRRPL